MRGEHDVVTAVLYRFDDRRLVARVSVVLNNGFVGRVSRQNTVCRRRLLPAHRRLIIAQNGVEDAANELVVLLLARLVGFVAPDVDVWAGSHLSEFADNVVQKLVRELLGRTDCTEPDASTSVEIGRFAVASEFPVGGGRRIGVAGHVDLGDDRDVVFLCVVDDLLVVFFRVVFHPGRRRPRYCRRFQLIWASYRFRFASPDRR